MEFFSQPFSGFFRLNGFIAVKKEALSTLWWPITTSVQKYRKRHGLGCVNRARARVRVTQPSPRIFLHIRTAQSVHTVWDQNRTDGSIKSQSAAESAAAKKRFLQIRSDALLRLFVSRQVDPASHQSTNHHGGRTHISKSDLGANGDGGIPLAGFQPFPTSPFPRSRTPDLCSAVKEFMGTRRTRRRSREVAIWSPLATRHD